MLWRGFGKFKPPVATTADFITALRTPYRSCICSTSIHKNKTKQNEKKKTEKKERQKKRKKTKDKKEKKTKDKKTKENERHKTKHKHGTGPGLAHIPIDPALGMDLLG